MMVGVATRYHVVSALASRYGLGRWERVCHGLQESSFYCLRL